MDYNSYNHIHIFSFILDANKNVNYLDILLFCRRRLDGLTHQVTWQNKILAIRIINAKNMSGTNGESLKC